MSDEARLNLLSDLVRLLKKHGPDAFSDLSRHLQDGAAIRDLTSVLDGVAEAGRLAGVRPKGKQANRKQDSIDEAIENWRRTKPDIGERLAALAADLRARVVLTSTRDIVGFVQDNGLGPVTASSRNKGVAMLLERIMDLEPEELVKVLDSRALRQRDTDRSLEGWSKIIMDKERKNRRRPR